MLRKTANLKSVRQKALDAAILNVMVVGIRGMFGLVNLRSPRFREALKGFDATYRFRAGSSARRLVFADGRIGAPRGEGPAPDYELILLDPAGVVKRMYENPDDMIKLLMENKIDQSGNNFYLFKFGYLLGLCERYFRDLAGSVRPDFFRQRKADADR